MSNKFALIICKVLYLCVIAPIVWAVVQLAKGKFPYEADWTILVMCIYCTIAVVAIRLIEIKFENEANR